MIRTAARKAMLLAVTTLFVGAAAVNCSSKKDSDSHSNTGAIGLAVKLSNGVNVDKVDYKISGNGITPITGSIVTSDPGATVAVFVSGIPAGTGYLVELSATGTDGVTVCGGSATFNVTAGMSSSVTVALQCRKPPTTGSVVVGGTLNNCPVLTSYVAGPLSVATGGDIAVGSSAADLDAGATLTYAWTATGGSFVAANAANTTYKCSASGAQTLTITVSDGACTASATIPVTCVALSCGNGVREPALGEECDPPNGTTCNADCITIAVCGDGKVEKAEQCDPPNGTTCDAACRGIPVVCGNSIVQPGETCDPPGSATPSGACTAACQIPAPPRCGDGVVNQPSEECDGGPSCNAMCKRVASPCEMCEAAQCDATIAGCGTLAGAEKTACEAFLACARTTHCAAVDAQACYCGTASDLGCLGGAANGVCKAQAEAAAGSTSAEDVATRFVDAAFPLGRAVNLLNCDKDSCTAVCPL